MGLSFGTEKDILSDLFRQEKSTTYYIHRSIGVIRMGESIA